MKFNALAVASSLLIATPAYAFSFAGQAPFVPGSHQQRPGDYPSIGVDWQGRPVVSFYDTSAIGSVWHLDTGAVQPVLIQGKYSRVHAYFVTFSNGRSNFSYDLDTGVVQQLSNTISGHGVTESYKDIYAWDEQVNGDWMVIARDQHASFYLPIGAGDGREQRRPTVSYDWVAWDETSGSQRSVVAYHRGTGQTINFQQNGWESYPQLASNADAIVWETSSGPGTQAKIYFAPLSSPQNIDTVSAGRCNVETSPRMDEERFVLYAGTNCQDGPSMLYLSDRATNRTWLIGAVDGGVGEETHYDIFADRIVWVENGVIHTVQLDVGSM